MKICNRCLYTSVHPLYLTFDDEGVCSGCRVHEEKDRLDWSAREQKLKRILEEYRNKQGNNYDCIIPVSGARDSYFIVHMVKKVYGMNPLLVTYNKHYNTSIGVRNLANLRIKFDCDLITQTINPQTIKKITRSTFRKFGSIYWHCLAGQTVFPVQIAIKYKIPLIIWGAHQGTDQVGMFSHLDEVEMTRRYRKEHDLMGVEAEDLVDEFDNITEQDVLQFLYPDDREIDRVGVRGIYLNNYIRWDTKAQHEEMIKLYGYETAAQSRTFDTYNDVDCWNYSDVHDYIKFIKHGYGKVTDHASREIRLRRMTRVAAKEMVSQYTQRPPEHLEKFLSWFGITEEAFHYVLDQHRNPNVWKQNSDLTWEIRREYLDLLDSPVNLEASLELREEWRDFILTGKNESTDKDDRYLLYGKGVL